MRLLLLSNSTNHGAGYLEHALPEIRGFFGGARRLGFVPFALQDQAGYFGKAAAALGREGFEVARITVDAAGLRLMGELEAVFVGGGNTFRLLRLLRESGVLEALRSRVRGGMPYMGASAGTNVASPTIRTTNDMPIVEPGSFDALAFVPFQINPHYLDADSDSTHMGETREDRLREYLEENAAPVLGLREGAWLRREDASLRLGGGAGARLFRREQPPEELAPGADLSFLLG